MVANSPYSSEWAGRPRPVYVEPRLAAKSGFGAVFQIVFVTVFIVVLGLAAIPLITS